LSAPGTYKIVGNVETASEASKPRRAKAEDGGFACGSVNTGEGGGPGGSSVFLSFLIGLVMLMLCSSLKRHQKYLV